MVAFLRVLWLSILVGSVVVFAQTAPANHLRGSHSAYLQRAASQPVDWHPLDQSALDLAKKLNRPMLLDVGATWCTWCTLMDRESYTHPDIADFINANFVAVKIDYDANPKLTAEIERAAALENLPTGIPLTLFTTPQGTLYFGGTYYPPRKTADKIPFKEALDEALSSFREHPSTLEKDGTKLHLETQP